MVYTYAQCYAAHSALLYKRLKLAIVGAIVARIYADLVHIIGSYRCNLWHKVYVGNNGSRVAICSQRRHNLGKGLALLATLSRESDNGRTRIGYALNLRHRRYYISSRSVGHRLHSNRIATTNFCCADTHLNALSASESCQIHIENLF